jgi:hypothetical protein
MMSVCIVSFTDFSLSLSPVFIVLGEYKGTDLIAFGVVVIVFAFSEGLDLTAVDDVVIGFVPLSFSPAFGVLREVKGPDFIALGVVLVLFAFSEGLDLIAVGDVVIDFVPLSLSPAFGVLGVKGADLIALGVVEIVDFVPLSLSPALDEVIALFAFSEELERLLPPVPDLIAFGVIVAVGVLDFIAVVVVVAIDFAGEVEDLRGALELAICDLIAVGVVVTFAGPLVGFDPELVDLFCGEFEDAVAGLLPEVDRPVEAEEEFEFVFSLSADEPDSGLTAVFPCVAADF